MVNLGISVPQLPRLAGQALRPLALLSLLGLLGALGAYWYVLVPAQENVETLRAAYEQERQKQTALRVKRKTQEDVRQIRKELVGVWKMIPAQKDFAEMAITISELAKEVRVLVPGMKYSHDKADGNLPMKASLSFQATGKYRDIYRFLHRLETTEPYLVIEQLNAARTEEPGRRAKHQVQFNIRVVTFLKQNAPPTSVL